MKPSEIAIRAARLRYRKNVGLYASWRYAQTRGCPLGLYRLACQLEVLAMAGL
mgnify:CR=1 FL=1